MDQFHRFCFLIFFVSINAMANFSGYWEGTGEMDFYGNKSDCSSMYFDLLHTETELVINNGHYQCGDMEATWDPFALTIKGNQLFLGDQAVGTITNNTMDVTFSSSDDLIQQNFRLTLKGNNQLRYDETWRDGNGQGILKIQGDLTKSN